MKIRMTFELDDASRRAIADYYGLREPANYSTCRGFIRGIVDTSIEDVAGDLRRGEEREDSDDTEEVDGGSRSVRGHLS